MIRHPLLTLWAWLTKRDEGDKLAPIDTLWDHLKKGVEERNPLALTAHEKMTAHGDVSLDEHPAVFAAVHNIPEIIEFLSPWPEREKTRLFTEAQWSPLHYAVEHEHGEVLLALLQAGFKPNLRNTSGQRAIDLAFAHEITPIIDFIIENLLESCRYDQRELALGLIHLAEGTPILDAKGPEGPALFIACRLGHAEIVNVLLDKGASLEYADSNGITSLFSALKMNQAQVIDVLLKHESISSIINVAAQGESPLMRACVQHPKDVIRNLLDKGASLEYFTSDGESALTEALYHNKTDIVEFLLEQEKISSILNVETPEGTPLMIACFSGHAVSIIQKLLSHGACLEYIDHEGKTALSESILREHVEIVDTLLEQENIASIIDIESAFGTPLMIACLLNSQRMTQSLLDKGASLECIYKNNTTCLSESILARSFNAIEVLLQQKNLSAIINVASQGKTPLMLAIQNNHEDIAQSLLKKGASIDYINEEGDTALSYAVFKKSSKLVELILSQDTIYSIIDTASDITDDMKGTPLMAAILRGYEEIAQALLKKDASIEYIDSKGGTALFCAVYTGSSALVEAILSQETVHSILNSEWDFLDGRVTPLMLASRKGHASIVQALLDKGACLEHSNEHGTTALIEAVFHNRVDVIEILLKQKGISSILNKRDAHVLPPLIIACCEGYTEAAQALFHRGASVEYIGDFGDTALSCALFSESQDITKMLLEHEGVRSTINVETPYGTPLMIACRNGFTEIVKMLLERGACLEHIGDKNSTALEMALYYKRADVVELLLQQKEISSIINVDGVPGTSLMLAFSVEIAQSLMDKGATLETINSRGFTALEHAISNKNRDVVKFLLQQKGISSIINVQTFEDTPLMSACAQGDLELIQDLLKYGASLDSMNEKGETALLSAIDHGRIEAIHFLMQQENISSVINVEGPYGPPLMVACYKGFAGLVKKLLDSGATLLYEDDQGSTPLSVALCLGRKEVVKTLLQHPDCLSLLKIKSRYATNNLGRSINSYRTEIFHFQDSIHFAGIPKQTPLNYAIESAQIELALNIIDILASQGSILHDDFLLHDISVSPILYAVVIEYFKPVLQSDKRDKRHRYTDAALLEMKEELYRIFSFSTLQEKIILLAHIDSDDLIRALIHYEEKTLRSSHKFLLPKRTTRNSANKAEEHQDLEKISIRHLSKEELLFHHHKGDIDLIKLLPLGIISLNQKIMDASLPLLEETPDAFFIEQDFSVLHAIALSSQIDQSSLSTKHRKVRRAESVKSVLDALALYKPTLASILIDKEDSLHQITPIGYEAESHLSQKRPLDYVAPSHHEGHRALYQLGADPFHKSTGAENSLFEILCREENIYGLFVLLQSCNPTFAKELSSLSLSSSALIRLLCKIKLRKDERKEDSILYRIIHVFKIPEFTSKEEYVFPVQEYTVDDLKKLHEEGKIDLRELIPVLLRDYDEKLLTACSQLDLIDFFSSSYLHGTLFHDIRDGRYFSLFNDFLKEEVNTLYKPDKQAELKEDTYQKYEALLHAFLFAKSDDIPSPFEVYGVENEAFYDEIKQLYTEDDGSLAWEVAKEELELLADFKKRYTEHHALKNKALPETLEDDSAVLVPAFYLPSTSVVCASSSARGSEQASVHHQTSEAAAAEAGPMEMNTHGFG